MPVHACAACAALRPSHPPANACSTAVQDLTQELLKLSVLYTALELSDKASCRARQSGNFARRSPHADLVLALRGHTVCDPPPASYTPSCLQICCSFGVDVLEALAASCTQLAAGWSPRAAFNLACDVAVASLLLVLHGATLMSQVRGRFYHGLAGSDCHVSASLPERQQVGGWAVPARLLWHRRQDKLPAPDSLPQWQASQLLTSQLHPAARAFADPSP